MSVQIVRIARATCGKIRRTFVEGGAREGERERCRLATVDRYFQKKMSLGEDFVFINQITSNPEFRLSKTKRNYMGWCCIERIDFQKCVHSGLP